MKRKIVLIVFHLGLLSWFLLDWDRQSREGFLDLPVEKTLTLTFAGDLMAHRVNFAMDDFKDIYQGVAPILQGDTLSFINLESPVNSQKAYQTYPLFNVKSEYVAPAIEAGFDVFSLANNHSTDQGIEGIKTTLDEMNRFVVSKGIYHNGLRYRTESPMVPTRIEREGVNIGFLSVSGFVNQWQKMEGTDYMNLIYHQNSEIRRDFLEYIRLVAPRYDLFVLGFHDGIEYTTIPWEEKVILFHELVDNGVDILWGHHPHVLQPWEWKFVDGEKRIIFYSLGNFISGQTWHLTPADWSLDRALTGESGLYQVKVHKQGTFLKVGDVEIVPIANYKDPDKGMVVRTFKDLLEEEDDFPWKEFYEKRWEILQPLLKPKGMAPVEVDPGI